MHKNNSPTTLIVFRASVNVVESKTVWHRRLGYPSSKVLNSIIKDYNVKVKPNEDCQFCDSCQLGKAKALPFFESTFHASNMFELIHTDV